MIDYQCEGMETKAVVSRVIEANQKIREYNISCGLPLHDDSHISSASVGCSPLACVIERLIMDNKHLHGLLNQLMEVKT